MVTSVNFLLVVAAIATTFGPEANAWFRRDTPDPDRLGGGATWRAGRMCWHQAWRDARDRRN
ncbi:MAG: hypothetical protein ACRDSZ_06135 [Pseudonocardiaceae bacterium]